MNVVVTPFNGVSISSLMNEISERNAELLNMCQKMSGEVWSAFIDDDYICSWGLIPPTIFSTQAYIWMHTQEIVQEHQFVFIRQSQRIIEEMLKRYETLVGHCVIDAHRSQRWLKLLGAKFGEPRGQVIPFTIRRR